MAEASSVVRDCGDDEHEVLLSGAEPRRSILRSQPWALVGLVVGVVLLVAGASLTSSSHPSQVTSSADGILRADEEKADVTVVDEEGNPVSQEEADAKTEDSSAEDPGDEEDEEVETPKTKKKLKKEKEDEEEADTEDGEEEDDGEAAEEKVCMDVTGVILDQDANNTKSVFPTCAAKWSEDCRQAGCCADWGMKCFEKDDSWSACNTECKETDDQNNTWSCKVLWPPQPRTFETCAATCRDSKTCRQAVYSSDNQGDCKHSKKASTSIVWAGDNVNSTLCGKDADDAKAMQDKVLGQLPFELPRAPRPNCSWSGEDCSQTKCCREHKCTKDFSNCWGYSCWKKTEYFAGCMDGEAPEGWDGTWLGGAQDLKVAPSAGWGGTVKMMGTSLYCFMVVAWDAPAPKPFWSTEAELVGNIKDHGLSIMQCDAHHFFDGTVTPKAEWGSFSNIDNFMETWKAVEDAGEWQNHDWTVKVDSDAIFLPDRLKQHLDNLRVPAGSRVYVENNDYRFKFMGALEIVSKPAVEVWVAERWNCIRGKHEGGEDFFMKGCLDALGVDHMIDHQLLSDTYAAQDVHCTDGWAASFHYHKSIIRWNWCYNEVVCGERAKTCDQGLEVEYVMDG